MRPSDSVSKISPPSFSNMVGRPSLTQMIANERDKGLTIILGQAAQGKSTLAALYINESSIPAVWINLGQEDSDPINLYYLLVRAFEHIVPEDECIFLQSYPSVSLGPRLEIPLFRDWAGIIFERLPHEMDIIFDGLDRLDFEAASMQFLKILTEEAPEQIHILITSREEPPFGIQDRKVKKTVQIIDNSDLAFSLAETKVYFQLTHGISLKREALNKIHMLCEGWTGGLVLLSEVISRIPEENRLHYIENNVSDYKIEVFRYFSEQLLCSLPESLQNILTKAAIFEVIVPDLIKTLIPSENFEKHMHKMVKKNLFMHAFHDDVQGWMFRYHALFREYLLDKLRSEHSQAALHALYAKAAEIYEQHCDFENAVRFFLKASAFEQAVPLIEKIGMDLVRSARLSELSEWLSALPEDRVQNNPWLLFYLCMTCRFTETKTNIVRLEKASLLFEKNEEIRGQILSIAFIIEASIFGGSDVKPILSILKSSDKLLESVSTDQFPYEKGVLMSQVGLGYALRGGAPFKGFMVSHNAFLIAKCLDTPFLQISSLANAVLGLTFCGEFLKAEQYCNDIELLLKKFQNQELKSLYSINLSAFLLYKGELAKAKKHIESAQNETEKNGLMYLYPGILLYDLMLRPHLGEFNVAEEIGLKLINITDKFENIFFKGCALFHLGLSYYFKKNFKKSIYLLDSSERIFRSKNSNSVSHQLLCNIVIGLLNMHNKQYKESNERMNHLFEDKNNVSSHLLTFHIYAFAALLKWNLGYLDEAMCYIQKFYSLAKKYNFNHMPWISRYDFTHVCLLAIELNVPEAVDYATHILTTRFANEAEPQLLHLSQHSQKEVRKQALGIRKRIHMANLPEIHILTFGGFKVLRGNTPMLESDWVRSQAKILLKAIISHGSHNVSKELLAEALWPETPPAVSENNWVRLF